MQREDLYYKTVDLLLDAYNSNQLEHGSCTKCAVGNLCNNKTYWSQLFMTSKGFNGKLEQEFYEDAYTKSIKKDLLKITGYTWKELAEIEWAFESSIENTEEGYSYYRNTDVKKGQFIGLTAVLNLLKEIHQVDKEVSEEKQLKLESIYNSKLQEV